MADSVGALLWRDYCVAVAMKLMEGAMDRFIVAALVLMGTVCPAFAAAVVRLPEPATITLFGLGAGGLYLGKKFFRRK